MNLKPFSLFLFVDSIAKLIMENSAKFEIRILKFIRGGSSSQHHAEFCHFTCLTEDGKKMYQE